MTERFSQIDPMNAFNETDEVTQINETNEIGEIDEINPMNGTNETNETNDLNDRYLQNGLGRDSSVDPTYSLRSSGPSIVRRLFQVRSRPELFRTYQAGAPVESQVHRQVEERPHPGLGHNPMPYPLP